MPRLAGKTAFITGAADGQGRAAARLFAKEGAMIVGCDLKGAELTRTAQEVQSAGGRMVTMSPVDLGAPDQAHRWIEEGVAAVGRIDILYNNASAARFGAIEQTSVDDWSFTMRNEIDLIFYVTRAAWPHMVKAGGGAIINTASLSGLKGSQAMGAGAHAAAKGAVIALTRQLAAEGAKFRIRANAISPGVIETPATAWLLEGEMKDRIAASVPLGRLGRPEDVAYCALYLASEEARWVTGANFVIDGGVSAV